MMVAVAFAAIPAILALVCFRIPGILAVALQALAMPPAPARRIILTPFGLGLANVTVF
jgi:hypothetical protein